MNLNNLKFQASSSSIKSFFDFVRNGGLLPGLLINHYTLGPRKYWKSKIIIIGWAILAAFFFLSTIASPIFLMMLLAIGFLGFLLLRFLVFWRVRKSPIFAVRAVHFNSVDGFDLEYRDNSHEQVRYDNIANIRLKYEFDKAFLLSRLGFYFLPKVAEYDTTFHFILTIKEGDGTKEIRIPFDIPRIRSVVDFIKSNTSAQDANVNIEGAKIGSLANRSLSGKEILIIALIIIFFVLISGALVYFDYL